MFFQWFPYNSVLNVLKKHRGRTVSQIALSFTTNPVPCMSNLNLFSQIISKIDRNPFRKLVKEKGTDKHQKGYDSWTHLISMVFCQFSKSQSVRDISNGLRSATGNLNHLGIQRAPSKSTISYQNKHRDWTLFRDFYYQLQGHLSHLAGFKQIKFKDQV